jgi:hypothetical protein
LLANHQFRQLDLLARRVRPLEAIPYRVKSSPSEAQEDFPLIFPKNSEIQDLDNHWPFHYRIVIAFVII